MAEAKEKAKRIGVVTIKRGRLSFPNLWEKKASVEGGTPKYSCSILMDPADDNFGLPNIEMLEAEFKEAAKRAFGDKWEKIFKNLDDDRAGVQDGDLAGNAEGDIYAGYEDMKYIRASNQKQPQLLDRDKRPLDKNDDRDQAILYGGCYCDFVVSIWGTKDSKLGGFGVFATLEVVRFRAKGESFGAAPVDADDYLDDLEDEEDEDSLV